MASCHSNFCNYLGAMEVIQHNIIDCAKSSQIYVFYLEKFCSHHYLLLYIYDRGKLEPRIFLIRIWQFFHIKQEIWKFVNFWKLPYTFSMQKTLTKRLGRIRNSIAALVYWRVSFAQKKYKKCIDCVSSLFVRKIKKN